MSRGVWVLLALGMVLPLRGYVQHWSLWLDELLVAQQIIERSFAGLTEPLLNGQNAPIGWLWAVKASIVAFGSSEWGLRLVPLMAAMATPAMAWLAFRRLLTPTAAVIALAVVVLAWPTAAYGATVKPYSTDVLAACVVLWAGARAWQERTRGAWLALAVVGVLVQWFSHPSVFMLGGVGLTLIFASATAPVPAHGDSRSRRWRRTGGLVATAAVWVGVFVVNYLLFLRLEPTWEWAWLYEHWQERGGFPPWPIDSAGDALWLPRAMAEVMRRATGAPGLAWAALTAAAFGAVRLGRTRRLALGFALSPIALTAVAAMLRRYPMADRLVLFLGPGAAMLLGAAGAWAATWCRERGWRRWRWVGPAAIVGPLAVTMAAWVIWPWMPSIEHTRPLMRRLAALHEPGEPVVVNHWAQHAYRYYAPRFGLGAVEPIVAPREDEAAAKPAFGRTLASLSGEARVWLLLTHYADRPGDEPRAFTAHAAQWGREVARYRAVGARLVLVEGGSDER